jgi:prepilin-type N-terminal cleavage/methylation domain-containing protein
MTDRRTITIKITARQRRIAGRAGRSAGRGGFTLTELLVVIGVIVLMIAMAVPLFNVFSGSRSIEGGQNLVSAMLQRARARALAMQERRGVFFFEDQATRKTAMLLVKIDDPVTTPNPAAFVLELDEQDQEMQLLPQGVGAAFVLGAQPGAAETGTANATATTYRPYGLIAFDGVGRIMTIPSYTTQGFDAIRYVKNGGKTQLLTDFTDNIGPAVVLGTTKKPAPQEFSHAGVLLYDKHVFAEVPTSGDPLVFSTQQGTWLDQNGTALVVNRYNGTIIKGE